MKAILSLVSAAAISFLVSPAHADYKNGATIKCSGTVTENGMHFQLNSSKVYSYNDIGRSNGSLFVDTHEERIWGKDVRFFASGIINPVGENYAFLGEVVTMSVDLMTTSAEGSKTIPTYRVAQKFIQGPGKSFSLKGSWSSVDHKDTFEFDEDIKIDYDVTCSVLTN